MLTELTSMSAVTVGSSEYSIPGATTSGVPTAQTTDGFFTLILDASAMLKGDEFEVRFYEKVISGATQRRLITIVLQNAQAELLIVPMVPLLWGWDITIKKNAGTDRAFSGSIRTVP